MDDCKRCGGLFLPVDSYWVGNTKYKAWRCIHCGTEYEEVEKTMAREEAV